MLFSVAYGRTMAGDTSVDKGCWPNRPAPVIAALLQASTSIPSPTFFNRGLA